MTQDAIVTKLLPDSMAEVVVTRTTACGGNCGSCEACMFQSELKTVARNTIRAVPGQRVVIESRNRKVFSAVILVYVMPLVFFLFGYLLAYLCGAGEGVSVAVSFGFLILSAVVLVRSQKNRPAEKQISFEIIS